MKPPLEQGSVLQSDWPDRASGSKPPKPRGAFFKELPVLIIIAFGLALLIKSFLVQAFWIPSESMEPTLIRGDRVLVNRLAYRFREPRRGEVIVFIAHHGDKRSFAGKIVGFLTDGLGATRPSEQDYIKRIIGLPGEKLQLKDGVITITPPGGKPFTLDEPYTAKEKDLSPFGPTTVPKDSFFVMGDNRNHSSDSRVIGPIRRSDIIGKAFVKVWPPKRWDLFDQPTYGGAQAAVLVLWGAGRRRRGGVPRRWAA